MNYGGGFRLVVRRGPQPNQVYELNRDMMTLGRDVNNEITVNDPEVSRHHCRLTRGPNGYTLEDLGSTNGTFVNGRRLTGAQPLNPGDLVGLGETVTLAYEASVGGGAAPAPVSGPAQQQYGGAPAPGPQGGGYAAPPLQQDPYYNPAQPGFGQQPQPAFAQQPYYDYGDQARGNRGCGVLIGCGIFVVLALVGWVVAIVVIDSPLDDVRGVSDIANAVPLPGSSVDNVENFVDALQNNCNIEEAKTYVCSDEASFLDDPVVQTGICGAFIDVTIDCSSDGNDVTCDVTPAQGGESSELTFNIKNGQICGSVVSFESLAAAGPAGAN